MPPPTAHVESLHFAGITSLRDVTLELTTATTLLIGANGAGKSNVVNALELLSRIVEGHLQEVVVRAGGFDRLLHVRPQVVDSSDEISLTVRGAPDADGLRNGYRAILEAGIEDQPLVSDVLFTHSVHKFERPHSVLVSTGPESRLTNPIENSRLEAFADEVRPLLQGIRVYHFDDVSDSAPPRKQRPIEDNLTLHSDASNIAPYLMRLRGEHSAIYHRLLTVIRNVAPFFDDFVLVPSSGGTVQLRWSQKGAGDTVFGSAQLSDGTLRFICLATLLLSPDAPRVIVLDEPELGLHPFAIAQLAGLLRQATADGRQAIVATQSPQLLDHFPIEAVAILERADDATVISRPDVERLQGFLDEYSLSDLWQMNLLPGGQPSWRANPDA